MATQGIDQSRDDGQLLELVCRGDVRAFEALYNRYKDQVYHTALAILNDPATAEDVLQDCFLRFHANADRIDGSIPLSPWLHRVTVNLAYNALARRKRSAGVVGLMLDGLDLGVDPAPDRLAERAETRDTILAAIDHLSFEHRIVVILFYLSEFSVEEIAYILDCPVGTVKSRLHYARHKLRSQLAKETQKGVAAKYGLAGA